VMWGTVLLMAVLATADPLRIGSALIFVSRPRPMLHLFAYWLGGIVMSLVFGLSVLFVLRDFAFTASTSSSTAGQIRMVMGGLALLFAALISVKSSLRQQVPATMPGGGPSSPRPQPNPLDVWSRVPTRFHGALQRWSLCAAFVVGCGMATPVQYFAALAAIHLSGATPGAQISAVVIYCFVAVAFAEIPLLSALAAPAKTQAIMLQVHNWLLDRGRRLLPVMLVLVGAFLITTGMGSV
jgi:Sap, sulfolipid-1-addressing protein